jgi:RNA 3'-terminal phosphate cyclase (ATP)
MITISGETGGGQLLRSSLTLSMISGQPFRMTRIRGARPKPGLMRQHLTCVKAAEAVSGATVEGAEIGSRELVFTPGNVRGGDYHFAIGSGGSTTLVMQTVLPALLTASDKSTVVIEGGTHNPMAPPAEFLQQCYLPALQRMGVKAQVHVDRPGFMQAGGGILRAEILPLKKWKKIHLNERGGFQGAYGQVLHAHLDKQIALREVSAAVGVLGWEADTIGITSAASSIGPGSIVMLVANYENITELTSAVAEMGRSAEAVGSSAAKQLKNYMANEAPVGVHLADQLLLPMALAGGGSFTTFALSKHTLSHMELIPQFVPVKFEITEMSGGVKTISVAPMKRIS